MAMAMATATATATRARALETDAVIRAIDERAFATATRARALETDAVIRAIDERAFATEEGARLAFTHDVDSERRAIDASGAGVDSDGKGNPGMIYARVFDGNGASGFRLGGEDALCVALRAPPEARYFSFAPYVYRRGARVVSAQAGHSINNANAKRDGDVLIFVATHSRETFEAMRTAFGDAGYDEGAVNLVPLFDDVRYGGGFGDLLSISFRVAFWPSRLNATGEDALGEWSRLEWPAFFARRASSGAARGGSTVSQALPTPTLNLTVKVDKQHEYELSTTVAPVVVVDGAARVGSTTLVVMPVDHARCRRDPFYSPWSTAGVSVRSACFGATTDALYSISRDFTRVASLRQFLIVVRGRDVVSRGRAAFTTIALYATGGPISSFVSARDVRVLAAIDDRAFIVDERSSLFAVAFGSSLAACARVAVPCVVAASPPARSTLFLVCRDYLNPRTATAPASRPTLVVDAFAL